MNVIADYLSRSLAITAQQVLILLLPALVLALALDQLSRALRRRMARAWGVSAYVKLTAPGVVIHELGHALFCVVFRHRIVSMQLFHPEGERLGYVEHAYNPRSLYQRIGNFFIGTGPIWLGVALSCLLCYALLDSTFFQPLRGLTVPDPNVSGWAALPEMAGTVVQAAGRMLGGLMKPSVIWSWKFFVFAYLIFCIGSHITLSPPDLRGAGAGLVTLLVTLLTVNVLTLWLRGGGPSSLSRPVVKGLVLVYALMLFVAGLNVLMLALVTVAGRVTGRH
jgi:hypothetical protein